MRDVVRARARAREVHRRVRARARRHSRREFDRARCGASQRATRARREFAALGRTGRDRDDARRRRARGRDARARARGGVAAKDDVDGRRFEVRAGALERLTTSETIEWDALDGKWRLAYTNAADVLGLLMASQRLGVPEVGDIFQSFGCANGTNTGITNEIRLSVPFLLSEAKVGAPGGVGLRVQASFKDVGRRRIALTFQEAQVSEISISPLAETLLAPAILPRSSLNHQVLMFIKELELKFPLRGALTSMGGGEAGAAVGTYHLTFCDEDMLIGRAAAGGIYIFTRA